MKNRQAIIAFVILGLLLLLLPAAGVFRNADLYVSDALYQRGNTSSGKIVLVEIDEETLARFGTTPAQWGRDVFARVLDHLNQNEDCHPAVIGLDVLFTYEADGEGDAQLVRAASRYDNVVTAKAFSYETVFLIDGNTFQKDNAVAHEIGPYDALAAVTEQGIVNAVKDKDGIIRHLRLRYPGADGERLPSFPLAIAQMYGRNTGTEIRLPDINDVFLEYVYNCGGYSESISFLDVYEGTVDPGYFSGKVVLIGTYAPAMQDEYLTAINHVHTMYGMEIHANAVDMLLCENYHTEIPDAVQWIVLALILAICIVVFYHASLPWMVGAWLLLTAGSILGCCGLHSAGFVAHPLWIPVGVTVLFAAGIAVRFAREAAERRELKAQFGKYVDPQVLKQIVAQGTEQLELEGKECSVAVLFVDICGFTSLSEKNSPKEVVRILNRFLELVTDCVMRNGGTLDKFIGDCAMAIWNAPVAQEDAVMKAVRSGMDMVRSSEKLCRELGVRIGFAVGIHCGDAVVGNIGSSKRMDYTAIGDTVNTASRLESLKIPGLRREGHVYVSQEVADALGNRIVTEDLGEQPIKGKEKTVRVYSVTEITE